MIRTKLGVLALTTLLFVGCAALQRGVNIVKYEGSGNEIMTEAPSVGQYMLYSSQDVASKVSVSLKKGEPIGFKKDDKGILKAVAGKNSYPVTSADTYYWKKN